MMPLQINDKHLKNILMLFDICRHMMINGWKCIRSNEFVECRHEKESSRAYLSITFISY